MELKIKKINLSYLDNNLKIGHNMFVNNDPNFKYLKTLKWANSLTKNITLLPSSTLPRNYEYNNDSIISDILFNSRKYDNLIIDNDLYKNDHYENDLDIYVIDDLLVSQFT